jgi:hypothetical protein
VIAGEDERFALHGDLRHNAGEWRLEGPLADVPIPERVEYVLNERIEGLVEEDEALLRIGAVQGERFLTYVLAQTVEGTELDVLRRLREVAERHRIIRLSVSDEWQAQRSEAYDFEHALLQREFYRKLSPRDASSTTREPQLG